MTGGGKGIRVNTLEGPRIVWMGWFVPNLTRVGAARIVGA